MQILNCFFFSIFFCIRYWFYNSGKNNNNKIINGSNKNYAYQIITSGLIAIPHTAECILYIITYMRVYNWTYMVNYDMIFSNEFTSGLIKRNAISTNPMNHFIDLFGHLVRAFILFHQLFITNKWIKEAKGRHKKVEEHAKKPAKLKVNVKQ